MLLQALLASTALSLVIAPCSCIKASLPAAHARMQRLLGLQRPSMLCKWSAAREPQRPRRTCNQCSSNRASQATPLKHEDLPGDRALTGGRRACVAQCLRPLRLKP